MNDLRALLDQLQDERLDYVVERSKVNSDAQGYKNAGIGKSTFYGWTTDERKHLNDLAQRVKREVATRVLLKFQEAGEDAADAIIGLMKSRNENIKLKSSTEVLDRVLGKASQIVKQDVTSGGEKITVKLVGLDD